MCCHIIFPYMGFRKYNHCTTVPLSPSDKSWRFDVYCICSISPLPNKLTYVALSEGQVGSQFWTFDQKDTSNWITPDAQPKRQGRTFHLCPELHNCHFRDSQTAQLIYEVPRIFSPIVSIYVGFIMSNSSLWGSVIYPSWSDPEPCS